jgi:type IV pilus assembly protein PilV
MRGHLQGSTLIEAMVAIVVFSLGILGLAGLNVALIEQTTNSQLRAQASYLAEEMLGLATADVANVTCYTMTTSGPATCGNESVEGTVAEWRTRVLATLPGATTTPPTISYTSSGTGKGDLTVTLLWKRPHEAIQHNYVLTTNLYPDF